MNPTNSQIHRDPLYLGEVTDADGSEDVIYHFVKGTRDLGETYTLW